MPPQLLSQFQILGSKDLKVLEEPVPEWPGEDGEPGIVRLLQQDAEEAMQFTKLMADEAFKDLGMFAILIFSVVDADNNKLFPLPPVGDPTYKEAILAHVGVLKKKSMRVLNRLQRVCLRLNSMVDSEVAIKKVLSEAVDAASPTSSR